MSRTIKASAVFLGVVALLALVGPWLSPNDYLTTNFEKCLIAAQFAYLFQAFTKALESGHILAAYGNNHEIGRAHV